MFFAKFNFTKIFRRIILPTVLCGLFIAPDAAYAKWEIVDKLDLSPFVPRVLDAFMMVARGTYEYFVGPGDGIIYILIWAFLAVSVFMYAALMWFPKRWTEFFGFSGGGEMWDGKLSGFGMAETVLKSAMRAIIAATFLLQVRPTFITEWLVNPFLEFGSIYTGAITNIVNESGIATKNISCPNGVLSGDWLSVRSCEFLTSSISDLSSANNKVIKRGFEFLTRGLGGLITIIPHGGQNIMNIITGIILIFTFVGCNLFMALLIIQGIFDFGMALILYPFQVLSWVAKRSDKWFDIWPAFSGIVSALQKLVVTMIACSFILIVNVAVVRALFNFAGSSFNVAAGGSATSNLSSGYLVTNAVSFGGHSLLWLSSILTFFLMNAIFNKTREQLNKYAPGMTGLYNQTKSDFDATRKKARSTYESIKKIIGIVK